jgi:hypothetical protein
MKKLLLLLSLFFLVSAKNLAISKDSISTLYTNGEFKTYCVLAINASDSVVNSVVNTFVQQMCYDIKGLFKWGLKGMSLANEKDELLVFDFKETRYDKQTHILKGIGDVIAPGVTTIRNISVDSKLTLRTFSSGKREVRLELASPNLFIRDMYGSFYFIPKGKQQTGYLQIVTNIRFAWFFDLFITQARYKKIMEWRLRQILKNIKEEANKRDR